MKKMSMSFINSGTQTTSTTTTQPKQQTNYSTLQGNSNNFGNNFMNLQGIKNVHCSSCSGHR